MGCRVFWLMLAAGAMLPPRARAQIRHDRSVPDSVTLIPGARNGAGWLGRWLLGANYRDLWTQPIRVERLDLARFAGGLTPACQMGGSQTAALDLRGAEQRQYRFRLAGPDLTGAPLPGRSRRTPAADVLRERVSSRHPAGGVVVAPLLEAAGVLHVEPRLGIMPDAAVLGEFRQVFAGMLGTIEEQPDAGFAGADRVENTEQLWTRLDASPEDRVDARAYLTARVVDILAGDWDRQFEKWTWAGYQGDGRRLWRPIPRHREQAFARFDGVIPSIARRYFPQLVSFGPSFPDVYGLTWSARALDRRFLVALEKPVWDSVARAAQARLTDAVLEGAVRQLPAELRTPHGVELRSALGSRRDHLLDATDAFYRLVAEYADIHATSQDDWAEVDRVNERQVRVRIALAEAPNRPYFERTFTRGETREIRLYLGGGNDRVIVRGTTSRSVAVRAVGGAGNDLLSDSSRVGLPVVRQVLTSTFFYDSEGDNVFVAGPGTEIDRRPFREPRRADVAARTRLGACAEAGQADAPPRGLTDPFRDFGSRSVPAPWLSFQPNVGLLIGAGVERYGYAFRKAP
ncbi:MAG: hypothetical protein HYW52_08415, partial [Gemmatimonadetes bacterium]|nr:hypothetical protein [Gemmatimonadota bacterium]